MQITSLSSIFTKCTICTTTTTTVTFFHLHASYSLYDVFIFAGTLDTVVGLICASFVFMAFMTLCMVCIASRKLSYNRKTRNTLPHHLVTREHAGMLSPPPFVPSTCECHKHLHYTKGSDTDYSEDTDQCGCDSGSKYPVQYNCQNCTTGTAKHIAVV